MAFIKSFGKKIEKGIKTAPLKFFMVLGVLIMLSVICVLIHNGLGKILLSQYAYERWKGDGELDFSQVSVFIPENETFNMDSVASVREKLAGKVAEAAITTENNQQLTNDCFSGREKLTVKSELGSVEVWAYGIGGDFFNFHTTELLSGCFFEDSDIMKDKVVLDNVSAWILFGSTNVAGETVTINEVNYYISGVVYLENDRFSKAMRDDAPIIYMDYRTLNGISECNISSYEVIMPEPVSKFGVDTVKANFPIKTAMVVENSTRFTLLDNIKNIKSFFTRSVRNDGIILPYWENASRTIEDYQGLCVIFMFIFGILPLIIIIYYIIKFMVWLEKQIELLIPRIREYLIELEEKKRQKQYAKGKDSGKSNS